jgi:hypothetical protein
MKDRPVGERPADFNLRIRETQTALRYTRVRQSVQNDAVYEPNDTKYPVAQRYYPSFAALQLYLSNDDVLHDKAVFESVPAEQPPTETIVTRIITKLRGNDARLGERNLKKPPFIVTSHPEVYLLIRIGVLMRRAAYGVDVVPITHAVEDSIFEQWLKPANAATMQIIQRVDGRIKQWSDAPVQKNATVIETAIGMINDILVKTFLDDARTIGVKYYDVIKSEPTVSDFDKEPVAVLDEADIPLPHQGQPLGGERSAREDEPLGGDLLPHMAEQLEQQEQPVAADAPVEEVPLPVRDPYADAPAYVPEE